MKKVSQLTVLLLLLSFTSCMSGFQNFNKQKFTGLKQMEPAKTELGNEVDSRIDPVVLAERGALNTKNGSSLDDESDANATMLKKAIEDKDQIIVVIKGKSYRLDNAVYDGFYNSIIGVMTPISWTDLPREYVEVVAESSETRFGSTSIYMNKVKSVRKSSQIKPTESLNDEELVVEKSNPTVQKDVQKKTNPIVKRSSMKQELQAINIRNSNGHKFHGAALVSIVVMVIGIGLLFGSFLSTFGLILLIGGYAIGLISRIAAAINFRIAKKKAVKLGKGRDHKSERSNSWVWVGLVLFSIPLLLIPLIVALIIVAASTVN